MPEFPLTDTIITSLNAQEPWPENVRLFQPYEVEQILLPDNASCLAVQAFLKMCNLPFEVEMRWNAEFMSPSGRVPFIKCGAFVVSELEPIVQFAANKGVSLCGKLSAEEKAEMRAYMSLITNVLVNAELYISWIDDDTYNAVTKVRNSSVYPWPLGWLQTRAKRTAVAKRLRALHWGDKTLDQVLADVEQCCNSLSQRLGERDYFFGTTPTPLDALVYGHVRALLSANGPKAALLIKPITTSLLKHVVRMVRATGMKLLPQEEYLITQAFLLTRKLAASPERNARANRSRMCIMNSGGENVSYNREMVYGFKPFASKQITMTHEGGAITCKYNNDKRSTTTFKVEDNHKFAIEIIEDVLDKVEEVDPLTRCNDKNDFELVDTNDENLGITAKMNDYLDTIEENDMSDSNAADLTDLVHVTHDEITGNITVTDNVMNTDRNAMVNVTIIDDDGIAMNSDTIYSDNDETIDSDGVVNNKHLEDAVMIESGNLFEQSDVTDSSKDMKEENISVCSSGDSKKSEKFDTPHTVLSSSGSQSTLKFPSDEEISVENLLKYLRERNAAYGHGHFGTSYVEVADID